MADHLRSALDELLADHGLQARPLDGAPDVLAVVDGDGDAGPWAIAVVLSADGDAAAVYAYAPTDVPEDRITAVSELCHRANFGLIEGCLEVDPDDGEVRIRAGASVGDQDAKALLEHLLGTVSDLAAVYGPALGAVVDGGADPAAAIAEAEAGN